MREELSQAKRERDFYMERVEQAKGLDALEGRLVRRRSHTHKWHTAALAPLATQSADGRAALAERPWRCERLQRKLARVAVGPPWD